MTKKKCDKLLNNRLLLILSPERSGSTLLSVLLGAHSHVIAPPEMHLLAYPDFGSWRQGYPSAIESLRFIMTSLDLPNDKTIIEKQFAGWLTKEIYYWLFEHSNRSSLIIVDKTPRYSRELSTLQRAESLNPFFIWLIRHPLGVAASRMSIQVRRRRSLNKYIIPKVKFPFFLVKSRLSRRKELLRQVAYWIDVNERIELFLEGIPTSRYCRVYFEELVRSPHNVINKICKNLELEFEPAMINVRRNVPSSLKWGLGDEKILTCKTIDSSIADSWKRFCSERILDGRTFNLMETLGVIRS